MSPPYEPRLLEAGETASLGALYEAVYGPSWREKVSFARYIGETAWPGAVSVVEAEGRIAGAQPAYDVPLWAAGREATATVLLDVATHPAFRRRGIFSRLIDHAVSESGRRASDLVLTTPNRASYRGFRRKREWRLLTSLEAWVDPIRPELLLQRMTRCPRWLAAILGAAARSWVGGRVDASSTSAAGEPAPPPSGELDDLWGRAALRGAVLQRRDAAWVRHRFPVTRGEPDYGWFAEHHGGRLTGYAVARLREIGGLPIAFLVDMLMDEAAAPRGVELVEAVRRWARSRDAAGLVFFGSRQATAARWMSRARLLRFPIGLTRRPYRVCATLPPGARVVACLLEPRAWNMTLADSDLA
jgi:GNAT superfamily N-acetyltransferase